MPLLTQTTSQLHREPSPWFPFSSADYLLDPKLPHAMFPKHIGPFPCTHLNDQQLLYKLVMTPLQPILQLALEWALQQVPMGFSEMQEQTSCDIRVLVPSPPGWMITFLFACCWYTWRSIIENIRSGARKYQSGDTSRQEGVSSLEVLPFLMEY
jgi:hypothetical protein